MSGIPLEQYVKLTEFLGATLGPDYEVVLIDLETDEGSVIAISNGQVSGRTVGDPLTGHAMQLLQNKTYMSTEYKSNYTTISTNGKMLRSSTFFIKDDSGMPQGMLCINFDDSRYQNLSDQVLKLRHPDAFVDSNFVYNEERVRSVTEKIAENDILATRAEDATRQRIRKAIRELGLEYGKMTTAEKRQVVVRLNEEGLFRLKGTVKEVAEMLEVSSATVYRYLDWAEKKG